MSVLKSITYFLAAVVLARVVGFAQSFIVARALGPTNFGIWVTFGLIASYSPILSLGTVETLVKEVPYFLGRRETDRLRLIEGSVLASLVLAGMVLVLLTVLSFLVLPQDFLGVEPIIRVLVFATIGIAMFTAYFYWRFAAYENFKAVAQLDAARSFFALAFIGGLAWAWGLRGAVVGYLLHEVTIFIFALVYSTRGNGPVRILFRRDLLIHAVRVGFPITIVWWVLTLQASVDRVVLGGLVGQTAVGHYGLGISVTNALALVPMVVGRVLYPKVNKQFGLAPDTDSMRSLVLAPTLAVGVLLANLQLLLLAGMPFLYTTFLPKYRPGLVAGEILVAGSFFVCLLRNGANYLIATHKERVFLKYIVTTLLFNIGADVALVKLGWGLEGVAVGTSAAGLLLSTLVWRRVLAGLGFGSAGSLMRLAEMYLPFGVLTGFGLVMHFVFAGYLLSISFVSVVTTIGLVLLANAVLGCVPVYRKAMAEWKTKLLTRKSRMAQPREAVDTVSLPGPEQQFETISHE